MAYTIEWMITGRILQITPNTQLTLSDLVMLCQDYHTHGQGCDLCPHLVLNLSQVHKFPVDIQQMRHYLHRGDANMTGWILAVTDNHTLTYVIHNLAHLLRKKLQTFATIDAALAFLKDKDQSLHDAYQL